ncbi:MAG: FIST N-terminal domain-containing protein, partial [Polyangiaceae bacterium]
MSRPRIIVREGRSELTDETAAVAELHAQVGSPDASLVLFFCSPSYDLPKLAAALACTFSAPLVGCTSAGQIGGGGY